MVSAGKGKKYSMKKTITLSGDIKVFREIAKRHKKIIEKVL